MVFTSNVLGNSNVQGDLSTQNLTVRAGLSVNGSLTAINGQTTLSNLTLSNLVFVGNALSIDTTIQTTNTFSINNYGTSTALKVVQFEGGGPGHLYNTAEFWDYQTLAMVIDPYGNVGIHTSSSLGYSFSAYGGSYMDSLTTTLSNVATLNVTSTANVATLNTSAAYISNIYTSNILGFVGSQWTGLVGNPLYYVPQVGIGSTLTPTANLMVTGNIYASNAVQTALLLSTTANVTTLNVSSFEYVGSLNATTINTSSII